VVAWPAARARAALRSLLTASLAGALRPDPAELARYAEPAGDPGLFGPGALAGVVFQTLHPLAMAGVADHSGFRSDPLGRLERTARFVAGTTFGPTPLAEELLDRVRRTHERVVGTARDGRRYSANDPALLTYVHVTEVWCFLRSFQRYGPRPLLRSERDRYLAEVVVVAERLGARDVPASVAEVRAYLAAVAGELEATPEALTDAAFDLLPAHARALLGATPCGALRTVPVRTAGRAFTAAMRWAVGPSLVAAAARARCALRPAR
jgi:uncharacterized protein (DUF2236 family)